MNRELFSKTELIKTLNPLKSLNFVQFEGSEFENKYFYVVLQEFDGIYKGIVSLGSNNSIIKDGKGSKIYSDGASFEGNWKNNKREGSGLLKSAINGVYYGEFKDDNIEGKGNFEFLSGDVYNGEFKNGKLEGGAFLFINNETYEGEFKNNKMEGRGEYTFANGDVYHGDFKDGQRHGIGIFNSVNGNSIMAEWKNDTLVQVLNSN